MVPGGASATIEASAAVSDGVTLITLPDGGARGSHQVDVAASAPYPDPRCHHLPTSRPLPGHRSHHRLAAAR